MKSKRFVRCLRNQFTYLPGISNVRVTSIRYFCIGALQDAMYRIPIMKKVDVENVAEATIVTLFEISKVHLRSLTFMCKIIFLWYRQKFN